MLGLTDLNCKLYLAANKLTSINKQNTSKDVAAATSWSQQFRELILKIAVPTPKSNEYKFVTVVGIVVGYCECPSLFYSFRNNFVENLLVKLRFFVIWSFERVLESFVIVDSAIRNDRRFKLWPIFINSTWCMKYENSVIFYRSIYTLFTFWFKCCNTYDLVGSKVVV